MTNATINTNATSNAPRAHRVNDAENRFNNPSLIHVSYTETSERPRFGLNLAFAAITISVFALTCLPSQAEEAVKIQGNARNALRPKTTTIDLPSMIYSGRGEGKASTTFNFHPIIGPVETPYQKRLSRSGNPHINPSSFTHTYPEDEIHGTTGEATYTFKARKVIDTVGGRQVTKYTLDTKVKGHIDPGQRERDTVSIDATVRDPFTFSNADPNATFQYVDSGMDYSFSLAAGTAFPRLFSDGLDTPGAIADQTALVFRGRLAANYTPDPDAFWSQGLSNAIDLYTLTITSDEFHGITANLLFGSNNSDFTLDFKNHLGLPFDPSNPADVASLEQSIENAFMQGQVLTDLEDLFTVGFTPASHLSAYTLGGSQSVRLTALETPVPEPASLIALLSGLAGLTARRKRK